MTSPNINPRETSAHLPTANQPVALANVVKDLCIINHLPFYPNDMVRTLNILIRAEVTMALDPSISEQAKALRDQMPPGIALVPTSSWKKFKVNMMPLFVIAWVCGIAVAKGFWMTSASLMLPPVAWVVLAGHFLN